MNKITIHNYEAFYLDYLEGNLHQKDIDQLFLFLENNPSIKAELETIDQIIHLDAEPIQFDKNTLYKTINHNNVDDYIIATIENEIEAEDANELTAFLNHSTEASVLAERYKKTILPKEEIVYPYKNKLKKKKRTIVYYLTPIISAAAVLLIILWVNTRSRDTIHRSVSDITDTDPFIDTLTVTKKAVGENSVKNTKRDQKTEVPSPPIYTNKDQATAIITPDKDNSITHKAKSKIDPTNRLADNTQKNQDIVIALPETMDFVPDIDLEEAVADLILDQENQDTQHETIKHASETLSIRKWATKVLREKVFKQKEPDTSPLDRNEVFVAVINKIDQSSKKIEVVYIDEENEPVLTTSQFSFTIGKFQYTRIKTR